MNSQGNWRKFLPITYQEVVNEIVRFTELDKPNVEHRVWMEALETGWNVSEDVNFFSVKPFHFDDNMVRLYKEGDSFIFDSLVFWTKPARQLWIHHALDRIIRYSELSGTKTTDLKILMHGDGPGNDSIFLASYGFNVDYYEVPGSITYSFAEKRFKFYGFWENKINPIYDYPLSLRGQYDVVLSFEVLEHLPDPITAIKEIHSVLKNRGIALITDDFGDLVSYLPTHLKSSARYFGTTPILFLRNGMYLTWYSLKELFKPYEFTKGEWGLAEKLALFRDFNVRSLYLSRHTRWLARFIDKLPYFRYKKNG
jgi:SAM-dependent methyltransferase